MKNFLKDIMKNWSLREKIILFSFLAWQCIFAVKAFVVISSTANIRIDYISWGGASNPSACTGTSGNCTVYTTSFVGATVEKTGTTGGVLIHPASGTYASVPLCVGIGNNGTGGFFMVRDTAAGNSATSIGMRSISDAGSSSNSDGYAICIGPRG